MDSDTPFVAALRDLDESDEEHEDERMHHKLLDAVKTLDGKKRAQLRQRTEVVADVSEYHVTSGAGKVGLGDLIGVLGSKSGHSNLKKQLNRVQHNEKVLSTPLSKPEQERITRSLAYEQTTKEVSKWDPVVEKNRKIEHSEFPLQKPDLRLVTSDKFVKRFEAHTPLELEVAALLSGGGKSLPAQKALTAAEEKALKAMSLEEARARRTELQKHRALLSYKEAKARRLKKIKSKKYHRILRKEKQKSETRAMEELQQKDPAAYLEKLQSIEADRIQERMSLKHRGASKQMKKKAIFGKYDDNARQMVQDMIQKNKELTAKIKIVEEESDNPSEEDSETEAQFIDSGNQDAAKNPWMSKITVKKSVAKPEEIVNVEAIMSNQKPDIDMQAGTDSGSTNVSETDGKYNSPKKSQVDIDELFESINKKKSVKKVVEKKKKEMIRKKKQVAGKKKQNVQDKTSESESSSDESSEESDDDDETNQKVLEFDHSNIGESLIEPTLERKKTMEDFANNSSDEESKKVAPSLASIPLESEITPSTLNSSSQSKSSKTEVRVDPQKFFTVENKISSRHNPDLISAGDGVDAEKEQRMTIADAFAADDVIDDFVAEKKDRIEKDKPKDIDLSLPGWGEWGGAGIKPSKKKRRRFLLKAPPGPPRKDKDLDNVIISETKDTSIMKHQVSELPFQYRNIHQFESNIRQPIGKTWNPETTYREAIKPKVATQLGAVINPIDKTETFKNLKGQKRKAEKEVEKRDSKNDKRSKGKHKKKAR